MMLGASMRSMRRSPGSGGALAGVREADDDDDEDSSKSEGQDDSELTKKMSKSFATV